MLNKLRQAKVFCWHLTTVTKIRAEYLPIAELPVVSGRVSCSTDTAASLSKLSQADGHGLRHRDVFYVLFVTCMSGIFLR